MKWQVDVKPQAYDEIEEAVAYYETKSTQAAARLEELIEEALVDLADHPQTLSHLLRPLSQVSSQSFPVRSDLRVGSR